MSKPRYFVRKDNYGHHDFYEVWERVGQNEQRICEIQCGGRKTARKIANALNDQPLSRK
jgi:hypothetical protein